MAAPRITVETTVNTPLAKAWDAWTTPEHITKWNFASDDWQCPWAKVELKVGGQYSARMEAKDGSFGFDFNCKLTKVTPGKLLEYAMEDGRKVEVSFEEKGGKTRVVETFDAETQNPVEMQKQGWQSIMNNYKKYAESLAA
ncbi:MAG TPA: SRPBCC family protein [Candidatus Peribacteria bacterium]|nr:SRPBCC family protein [Candidatus Peribacteria bacterium]